MILCEISRVEKRWPLARIELVDRATGLNLTAVVTSESIEKLNLRVGIEVSAAFKATAAHEVYDWG